MGSIRIYDNLYVIYNHLFLLRLIASWIIQLTRTCHDIYLLKITGSIDDHLGPTFSG